MRIFHKRGHRQKGSQPENDNQGASLLAAKPLEFVEKEKSSSKFFEKSFMEDCFLKIKRLLKNNVWCNFFFFEELSWTWLDVFRMFFLMVFCQKYSSNLNDAKGHTTFNFLTLFMQVCYKNEMFSFLSTFWKVFT